MLLRMSPELARLRHSAMSVLRSLTGEKRTYLGQPISVAFDPKAKWRVTR
jgi:hypothetical protein